MSFHSSLLLLGSEDKLCECPETSCTEEFLSQAAHNIHIIMFANNTKPQPVKESLYNRERDCVDHFQTLTIQSESSTGATAAETESLQTPHDYKWDGHFKRNTQV